MRDLPRSLYATPGMVGLGEAKVVPNEKAEGLEGMVVVHGFANFYVARNGGGENASTFDLIRNECRLQMTPELQQNLAQATVTISGFGFARFLGMTRGREAEWLGDRVQTYRLRVPS